MNKQWLSGLAYAVAIASPLAVGAPITAAPPAAYAPPPAPKVSPLERVVPADAPKIEIDLAPPTAAEWSALRAQNHAPSTGSGAPLQKAKRLAIGMARTVPAAQRAVSAATLQWIATANDVYAARIDVRSPGAAAVRIGIAMTQSDPDLALHFVGSATGARVFSVPANAVAAATRRDGIYWSPVLEGDTGTVEIVAPAGVDRNAIALSIASVAHLALAGQSLVIRSAKDLSEIGTSGSCNVDVTCALPTDANSIALATAANASGLVVFNDAQFVYECSGTLVNDSRASNTPYFYTANHCLQQPNGQLSPITASQLSATMNFYWLFQAARCNDRSVPAYALEAGGATVLGRSDDWDWALLRVNGTLPVGVAFSGWRAEPLTSGTAIALHHPNGDLTKYSKGAVQGFFTRTERDSTYMLMRYSVGTTEPGSSGGGLFTLGASGYELRGGLWGGDASCSNPSGSDEYSRLDVALPLIRQYLAPDDTSSPTVSAVEFYNAALDHYFISADPGEINDLDTGVHVGWVRTGLRFLAYPDAAHVPAGVNATPVCRFYLPPNAIAPGVGDSHFYSPKPSECDATRARFPAWDYESPNVYYIQLPDATGACPANTRPVWRFYHTTRTNHRYTAEVAVRDQLASDPEWILEADTPGGPLMCSPTS